MLEAEKTARLRLARTDGVGPVTFRRLIERYGSAARALEVMPDLAKRGGSKKPLVPFPLKDAETEIAQLHKLGAGFIVWGEEDYPAQLAALEDAPMILSILGDTTLLKKQSIAIVGSRNASLQGRKFAENIASDLGRAGIVTVSGLARGIDTAAHVASIATGTIAVVAGGVDVVYPAENKTLYNQVAASGAIVAENAFGTAPTAQHFPRRNRIVSGLSRGVVIVEGTLKSGSLITAHMAADQGREVFAVPGHPFDPRAAGPNSLIRDGAALVSGAEDILQALTRISEMRIVREPAPAGTDFPSGEPDSQILDNARKILMPLLSTMPVTVDEIIRTSGIPAPAVQTVLLELELAGRLTRHPGNRVSTLYIEYAVDKAAGVL